MKQREIRLSAGDFRPELLVLFDRYVHGLLGRAEFLTQASPFATQGKTAAELLDALSPDFVLGQQIAPDDPRIRSERVEFPSPEGNGTVNGYLVWAATPGAKLPAVLVVHENRGLNPHIEDVTRRLALANFIAFAPDALFTRGGYPGDEDQARELFQQLDKPKNLEDFVASTRFLLRHPDANGKVGAVGFCYGGGVVHQLAARLAELGAAVPFYGSAPAPELAARVKAPLLVHLAEHDERVNASFAPYEAALLAAKVPFQAYKYPGTQHGFNNDTTPRYDEAAAKLAWRRTIDFFERHLRTGEVGSNAQASG